MLTLCLCVIFWWFSTIFKTFSLSLCLWWWSVIRGHNLLKAQMMVDIFSNKIFFSILYFFRHNTVAYLIRLQNSINMTFICTGKGKNSFDSLYCNICFIVVIQNWNCNISKFCLWFLSGWKSFVILRSNSYWFLFSSFWKNKFHILCLKFNLKFILLQCQMKMEFNFSPK